MFAKRSNGTCPCYLFAQGQLLLEKSMNGGIDWGNYMYNYILVMCAISTWGYSKKYDQKSSTVKPVDLY